VPRDLARLPEAAALVEAELAGERG
jgi:hypothetical protein